MGNTGAMPGRVQVLAIEVPDFFIGTLPVTQAFWDTSTGAGNKSRS